MSGIRTTTCSVIQRCPSQPVCPAATQTTLYVEWSLTFTCSQWPTTSSVPSHHRWELVTGEVMSLLHLYRLITGEYSSHVRSWLYLVCTFSSQVSTRHRWGHVSPFSLPSHHRWVLVTGEVMSLPFLCLLITGEYSGKRSQRGGSSWTLHTMMMMMMMMQKDRTKVAIEVQ